MLTGAEGATKMFRWGCMRPNIAADAETVNPGWKGGETSENWFIVELGVLSY